MLFLLIDNSNTRTKFRFADASGLQEWKQTILTRDISPEVLATTLGDLEFDHAILCSVVPAKAAILRDYITPRSPLHQISCHSKLSIGIDYPFPEQIGADRLANAVAAHARFGAPSVVIDFGTAVTFDVIGAPGAYLGGVIAPGLATMTDILAQRTALLPQIDLQEPEGAIGKSTIHAMQVGAVLGYRGMIREILKGIRQELPADPTVVATGGDATLIARGLPEITHLEPDLTMEGVWRIATANS
ncbi:MAG: type III pantothenate kinase [Verrucomicrobia bacterium]|nr:type III pantothenate kinase [Verrucomicrobiota bacterium]